MNSLLENCYFLSTRFFTAKQFGINLRGQTSETAVLTAEVSWPFQFLHKLNIDEEFCYKFF